MLGVLRSEWTKFYSNPWCITGLVAALLVAPIVVVVMGANVVEKAGVTVDMMLAQCLMSMALGQAGIVVMSAGLFGQEFDTSSLRTTFLAVSQRTKVLIAKGIVLTVVTIFATLLSGFIAAVTGSVYYDCDLTGSALQEYALQLTASITSWVLIAWICAALSVITKTQIVPIAIMFPLILGISQMLLSITQVARFLPDLAAMNLFMWSDTTLFLPVWQGISVQSAWAVLFMAAAVILILRRDVR